MPKKTKKEKILAEYRKKIKLLDQAQTIKTYQPSQPIKPTQIIPEKPADETQTKEDNRLLIYFHKDVQKSLLIITFIIALEFALYFAKLIK